MKMDPGKIWDFIELNWGIRPKEVRFIEEGDSTNNWQVSDTEKGVYILRNGGKFSHYVRFQCDILNFLQEKGFPYQIPAPIRAKNDDFVVDTEEGSYLFYKYIDGKVLESVTVEEAFRVGLMLAIYHSYIDGFDWYGYQQLRSKDLLDKEKMRQFMMSCRWTVEEKAKKSKLDLTFLSRFDGFVDFYINILEGVDLDYYCSLPKIPCHGDFERRNILKKGGRLIGFIDLGGVTIDPSICDLQSCIQLNCRSRKRRQLDMNLVKAVVSGYISQIKLDRRQLELIPPLMYSEMLKTLCWVMAELVKPESRVDSIEASDRIEILFWIKNYYLSLKHFFRKFSKD